MESCLTDDGEEGLPANELSDEYHDLHLENGVFRRRSVFS